MSTTNWSTDAAELLPEDGCAGTLVGRAWVPFGIDDLSRSLGARGLLR